MTFSEIIPNPEEHQLGYKMAVPEEWLVEGFYVFPDRPSAKLPLNRLALLTPFMNVHKCISGLGYSCDTKNPIKILDYTD